jgi:quercetin dioxygenase-like cupin family protein/DNA-binding XRE family transcriptional regulator
MASETIEKGLKRYAIGQKLRRLRLRKSMGLTELGRHTGLSPALLSKLERNLMHPTLPTLLRIAMVFSVGLEHFFNPETRPVLEIVRRRDRIRFPDAADGSAANFFFESLDFPVDNRKMNAFYAEFEQTEPGQARVHQHPGIEFIYLISGRLRFQAGSDEYELGAGDSIYFDSNVPHSYGRVGKRPAAALVVTAAG